MTTYAESTNQDRNLFVKYNLDSNLKKTKKFRYFIPYNNKFASLYALVDTMIIPRPCAYKSANLTSVDYFRGQKAYPYSISQ